MDFVYSIVGFFVTGGPFMYPILLVFAVGAAIAIERYRLAEKQLPATLDQLSPKYLTEIPVDPVTDKPLHYKKNSEGF